MTKMIGISVSFVTLHEHGGSIPRYVVVDKDIQINTGILFFYLSIFKTMKKYYCF